MTSLKKNQRGFSALEGILLVLVIAAIGFVGWYVYKNRATSSTPAATTSSIASTKQETAVVNTPLPSGSSNSDLSSDLSNISSTSTQSNNDINAVNSGLNDQSSMTSVPQ